MRSAIPPGSQNPLRRHESFLEQLHPVAAAVFGQVQCHVGFPNQPVGLPYGRVAAARHPDTARHLQREALGIERAGTKRFPDAIGLHAGGFAFAAGKQT